MASPKTAPDADAAIEQKLRDQLKKPLDKKILQLRIAKIMAKRQAGKLLSKREQAELDAFSPPEHATRNTQHEDWVSSDAKLSQLFGPHRASFPRFRKQYADAPRPRPNGDHSTSAWRAFFASHPEALDKAGQDKTLSRLETKDAIEAEKLREKKFNNDLKEGLYLPKAETAAALRDLGELQKSTMRTALEDDLPPVIQNQPAAAIRVHMKELVDRLCRQFQEAFQKL